MRCFHRGFGLQELGRRWHDLPKEEQQRYYELAKTDREQHMQKYPGWSARENYAINKKKKRKRDKSVGKWMSLYT